MAALQRENERAHRFDHEISSGIADLWTVMQACVARRRRLRRVIKADLTLFVIALHDRTETVSHPIFS
jgi:L-serine deaminase